MPETHLRIISDCYPQEGLNEMIQAIMRQFPRQTLHLKSVSNIAMPSDPTVIASLIAGTALVVSKLTELLVTELLRRHREKQARNQRSETSADTKAESVTAVVLVYDAGQPSILIDVESVPDATRHTNRTILEIRLTQVEPFSFSRNGARE